MCAVTIVTPCRRPSFHSARVPKETTVPRMPAYWHPAWTACFASCLYFGKCNDWLPYATGLVCFVPSLVFKTHLYAGELQVIGGLSYCELPMLWAASRRKCLCLGSGEGFPKERPFELDLEG